jgi:predicted deacetylase
MVVRSAQYLLRFDDLCPTMARERWEEFLPLIEEFDIHPILAVIPDNRDRELQVAEPDPQFWAEMRRMEARGASIALHGYRHFCASSGRGMLRLHGRNSQGFQKRGSGSGFAQDSRFCADRDLRPNCGLRHGTDLMPLR